MSSDLAQLLPSQVSRNRRRALKGFAGLGSCLIATGCAGPVSSPSPKTVDSRAPLPAPVAPAAQRSRPKWALAFGGGAARGFAHLGVISVLLANRIQPDFVLGTSAGSVLGALYAAGVPLGRMRELAATLDETRLTDWSLFNRGVIKGQALQDQVNKWVEGRPIERFVIPFTAVATDLFNGEPKLFTSGDAGLAVRASSAVPGVFEPVKFQGREYVDGGLVAPIPAKLARERGADYVVAVDISSQPRYQSTDNLLQVMLQSFSILGQRLGAVEMASADLAIRPAIGDLGLASFEARERLFEEGRRAMAAGLPKLQKDLGLV